MGGGMEEGREGGGESLREGGGREARELFKLKLFFAS